MSQLDIARAIAAIAHRGQVDKAGQPYIQHPQRVADRVALQGGSERDVVVAWLHDVLEDSDLTADDLLAAGVDSSAVREVEALTHEKGVSNEDYWDAINPRYTARKVKLADIADNTDIRRLALLDDKTIVRLVRKYAHALELLA
jgi:(p)ppGpp synthase/HD superfamily hydrolase